MNAAFLALSLAVSALALAPAVIKEADWRVGGASAPSSASFRVDGSHVLAKEGALGRQYFFSPLGLESPALVAIWRPLSYAPACLGVRWGPTVKGRRVALPDSRRVPLLSFAGVPETVALVALAEKGALMPPKAGTRRDPQFDCLTGHAWALLELDSPERLGQALAELDRWRAGLGPDALLSRELARSRERNR